MKRFRGELVFKAHTRLYLSTLGLRLIKKKKEGADFEAVNDSGEQGGQMAFPHCLELHHKLPDSGERQYKSRA